MSHVILKKGGFIFSKCYFLQEPHNALKLHKPSLLGVQGHERKTRRGSPINHRSFTAEAPPIGKIHPTAKLP